MSLALLFHYLLFNMFRMLIHPSSGACDLFVELFHGLYCSGSMCVGVTLWFGWGGVVSGGRLKQCFSLHKDTTPPQCANLVQYHHHHHHHHHQVTIYERSVLSVLLRAGRCGDRIPVRARFFTDVQTGCEAHPASYTMGTGSFPGVKRPGRGVDHPHSSSAEVKERLEL